MEKIGGLSRMNSVIPGTVAQIREPFPVVGDFVPRFGSPKYPHLSPAAAIVEPKEATNKVIRNPTAAPATRPHYGFPMPAKF